jgi:hydrogenase maturation protease
MTLVIGCGNLLRGDDAVGPLLVRRMLERGLPPGVEVADGGTSGMDVAFRMRGVGKVVLVDAATTGGEPGTLYRLTGADVETLPPLEGINLHAFRWDHALAIARWALKDEYPTEVEVFLIEAGSLQFGDPLTTEVEATMDRLAGALVRTGQPEPVS